MRSVNVLAMTLAILGVALKPAPASTDSTILKDSAKAAISISASNAPPTVTDTALLHRVAALEAYIQNGDPSKTSPPLAVGVAGPGHNGFMMICSALVLFMTLPGLFLFYGGLVRSKNILSIIAQCFGIAGMVTILWWAVGYSLVFDGGNALIGGLGKAFLHGVTSAPNTDYAYWVSENVFSMYQLMFAIITPALILGAVAERMRF